LFKLENKGTNSDKAPATRKYITDYLNSEDVKDVSSQNQIQKEKILAKEVFKAQNESKSFNNFHAKTDETYKAYELNSPKEEKKNLMKRPENVLQFGSISQLKKEVYSLLAKRTKPEIKSKKESKEVYNTLMNNFHFNIETLNSNLNSFVEYQKLLDAEEYENSIDEEETVKYKGKRFNVNMEEEETTSKYEVKESSEEQSTNKYHANVPVELESQSKYSKPDYI